MSKKESIVICKNCRQEIRADKMFLHEGFCERNNVFCEHCERVYLKEDYAKHKLEISKEREEKPKDSSVDAIKSNKKNKNPCVNQINLRINKPILEYEQGDFEEEFHINNPIIIAPTGEIVSKKNENEFLLPYLGYDCLNNKVYKNNDNILLNQEENINDNIDYGNLFFNNEQLMKNDYNNNNNINTIINNNELNFQNNVFMEPNNDNFMNIIQKEEEVNNSKKMIINLSTEKEMTDQNINMMNVGPTNSKVTKMKNDNSYEQNNIKLNDFQDFNLKNNKNNIITNANYVQDSINNFNKISDIFNIQNDFNNKIINNNVINNEKSSKYKINTYFNPIRKTQLKNFKQYKKKKTSDYVINNNNNDSELNIKEPSDNVFKKNLKNHNINIEEKNNQNIIETKIIKNKNLSSEKKNLYNSKKCKYCNNYIFDLNLHYKNCLKRKESINRIRNNKSNEPLRVKKDKTKLIRIKEDSKEDKNNNRIKKLRYSGNEKEVKKKLVNISKNDDDIMKNNENNSKNIINLNPNTDYRNYSRKIFIIPKENDKNEINYIKNNEISNDIIKIDNNNNFNIYDPLFYFSQSMKKKKIINKGISDNKNNNNEKDLVNSYDNSIHFKL